MAGPRSPTPPVTAKLISRRWSIFSWWCYADFQQRSNERLFGFPETRSSSFHGVEKTSRLDGKKLFENRQSYGWPCSPKHGPVPFTVFKNLFFWMLCSQIKTFKFSAGPRSPINPVTALLISRRWKIFLFWCYADFQQRSNQRLVVLPQTRSSSLHGW